MFPVWGQLEYYSNTNRWHCVKSVPIRSYSDLYFPAFRLNTEKYIVSRSVKQKRRVSGKKIFAKTIYTTIEMVNFSFDLRKGVYYFWVF